MRALAAFGGSASMVIPRAIVRDLSEGLAAARMMSRLTLVMGVAPILAPTLGGLVLGLWTWHAIFWFAVVYGAACLAIVAWTLPDTLPRSMRVSLSASRMLHRYLDILTERSFITHALAGGCSMFAMFAYLGGSPGVFIERFGLGPGGYGAMFGACAAGYIGASQLNPMVIQRFGPGRVLRTAVRVMLGATLLLGVLGALDIGPWYLLGGVILVTMGCNGFILPNAVVGALQRHAGHAGSASALMGMLQFCLGAVSGITVGLFADGTARPMAALMILGALGAVLADAARTRARLPEPKPVPARAL